MMDRWQRGPPPSRSRGKRVAWATPPALSVSLPQLPLDQKAVCQHHGERMAVKTWPQPALVLFPAQLAFRLLMELLDGIPAVGIAG